MRTTLTLEEDVAAKLKAEMRRSGQSLKETVNQLLRLGLTARPKQKEIPKFVVRPLFVKHRSGLNYDCVGELLEQLEGPLYR